MTASPKVSIKNVVIGTGVSLAVIIILLIGYVIFSMSNFVKASRYDVHETMTDDERYRYSAMALLPEISDDLERYGIREYSSSIGGRHRKVNHTVIDTCLFSNIDEMCEALPQSYTRAIREAIEYGESRHDNDIALSPVTYYPVNNRLLPLSEAEPIGDQFGVSESDIHRYYSVIVYGNGYCRFSVYMNYDY